MEGLMNLVSFILALVAWMLPLVILAQYNKINCQKYAAFTVISFIACAVSLCIQLFYTDHLVKIEDWSALMDTSHAVALVATLLLVVTAVLNTITLFVYFRKNCETGKS